MKMTCTRYELSDVSEVRRQRNRMPVAKHTVLQSSAREVILELCVVHPTNIRGRGGGGYNQYNLQKCQMGIHAEAGYSDRLSHFSLVAAGQPVNS
jgi:hypothetical protein